MNFTMHAYFETVLENGCPKLAEATCGIMYRGA